MITKSDLIDAINSCESEINPNADTCLRLAAYYTILDKKTGLISGYSQDARPMYISDTDFGNIIKAKDINDVLSVIDELLTVIHITQPALYKGFIRKLDNL